MYYGALLLMKILTLLFTSLAVSIDSFFCGLSLSLKTKAKFKCIIIIASTVFCLCLLGANVGFFGNAIFKKYSNILGGIILCALSFNSFKVLSKSTTLLSPTKDNSNFIEFFLAGLSIGVDGMVGAISLTLVGFNYILVTLTITVVHVLLLLSSFYFCFFIKIKNENILNLFPSTTLLILGAIKLLSI